MSNHDNCQHDCCSHFHRHETRHSPLPFLRRTSSSTHDCHRHCQHTSSSSRATCNCGGKHDKPRSRSRSRDGRDDTILKALEALLGDRRKECDDRDHGCKRKGDSDVGKLIEESLRERKDRRQGIDDQGHQDRLRRFLDRLLDEADSGPVRRESNSTETLLDLFLLVSSRNENDRQRGRDRDGNRDEVARLLREREDDATWEDMRHVWRVGGGTPMQMGVWGMAAGPGPWMGNGNGQWNAMRRPSRRGGLGPLTY